MLTPAGYATFSLIPRTQLLVIPRELMVGRVVAGPDVGAGDILLDNVEWSEAGTPDVSFSDFTVNEVSKSDVYNEFQYKVLVSAGKNIESGAYDFRMNLLVSNQIRSYVGRLLVITRISESGGEHN